MLTRIIIAGPKGSGKTTVSTHLGQLMKLDIHDVDHRIEQIYARQKGEKVSFREIFNRHGEDAFREWERNACSELAEETSCIIAAGGGTMYQEECRDALLPESLLVYLHAENKFLWERLTQNGLPKFLQIENGYNVYVERNNKLRNLVMKLGALEVDVQQESPEAIAREIYQYIKKLDTDLPL